MSPRSLEKQVNRELFERQKKYHLKKKLNFVNFTEHNIDIINDEPYTEKYDFYKGLLDQRVKYERPLFKDATHL